MVQIIQIFVPKGYIVEHYTKPCAKDVEELERDHVGIGEVVERLVAEPDLTLADAVVKVLEFGGLRSFNVLITTEAKDHIILRFRANRKRGNQFVNLVKRSIGVGVHTGFIEIQRATSMPSMPRSKKEVKTRKGQFFRDDRLTDNAIYEAVDNVSHLTFDYLVMLIVGSLISGVGLITDSAVTVVASMLVSPLMGPILCIAFGLTVSDSTMMRRGLRNEIVGVGICFGMGLLFGFVTGPFYGEGGANIVFGMNTSEENLLESYEINSRGKASSLLPGFFVAAPSGFGAALAINTDGANALVGVAISAALLPPLVNCGFCVAFAAFTYTDVHDWVYKGLFSGLLFVMNLVCIIIFASLAMRVYRIKPLQSRAAFWQSLRIPSPGKRNRSSQRITTLATAAENENPDYVEMSEHHNHRQFRTPTQTGRRSSLPSLFIDPSLKINAPNSDPPAPASSRATSHSRESLSRPLRAEPQIGRASSMLDQATIRKELARMGSNR